MAQDHEPARFLSCTSVIPAGAQTWNVDVADASGTRAAYCSTLAIYIYDITGVSPRLEHILSASDKTILSIAWNPHDPNVIAMSSAEDGHSICLWDLQAETVTKRLTTAARQRAKFLAWSPFAVGKLVAGGALGTITELMTAAADLGGSAGGLKWKSTAGKWSSGLAETMHNHPEAQRLTVMRLSPRVPDRYVLGFDSGLVLVLSAGSPTMDVAHKGEAAADCRFDPLSDNYLLVGFRSGLLHMYDVDTRQPIQTFDKAGVGLGLQSLAWVPGVPGDFVSVTERTGLLRVWNVSGRSPRDTLKAEGGPFHGISFVEPTQRLLCRFRSGAVGLCELPRRTWAMFGRAAHTDTVFGAAFKPDDPSMLATCSFDGSVRIWDTRKAALHRDLLGEDVGVLYGIAWSPAPGDPRLATASSRGQLLLWHVDNGVMERRVDVRSPGVVPPHMTHPGSPWAVYCVDWGAQFLCCSSGSHVAVCGHAGDVLLHLRHPDQCFGVSWHAANPLLLASACADGVVRTFEMTSTVHPKTSTTRETKLVGHTKKVVGSAKHARRAQTRSVRSVHPSSNCIACVRAAQVFGVLWSPLLHHLLLSGSDDHAVRLWDTRDNSCRVLSGHSHNVRALHWSSSRLLSPSLALSFTFPRPPSPSLAVPRSGRCGSNSRRSARRASR